jgi:hypothetical protein
MTTPTPTHTPTGPRTAHPTAGRVRTQLPVGVVVAIALLIGLLTTMILVLVVFAGATEPVITGSALLGLASGWALIAVLTARLTSQPQRWAAIPAVVLAAAGVGLLAATPDNDTLTAAGWVWPLAAVALAVWMLRAARRALNGRARWLVYPVIGALAVTAVGGIVESVALTRDAGRYPMPGASYDVGGHRLHLNCMGTGGPTVVLENGLAQTSPLWSAITAQVARTTATGLPTPPTSGSSTTRPG